MSYPTLSAEALAVALALDQLRRDNPDWGLGQAMDQLRTGTAACTPDMDTADRLAKWLVQIAPLYPEGDVKVGVIVSCNHAVLGGARKTSLAQAKLAVEPGALLADMASQALSGAMQGWPTFIQLADLPLNIQAQLAQPIGGEN